MELKILLMSMVEVVISIDRLKSHTYNEYVSIILIIGITSTILKH